MLPLLRHLTRSLLLWASSLLLLLCLLFAGLRLSFSLLSSFSSLLQKTGSPFNSLYGAVALSPSNVWAVGETSMEHGTQPLIEHWNGVAWSVTASPSLPVQGAFRSFHRLKAVSARRSNDIWAVGCSNCSDDAQTIPLIEHWDGASWTIITVGKNNVKGALNGVSVLSPTNAWAVGSTSNNGQNKLLLEQWNGATWQVLSHPGESLSGNLNGVAALSPENVWVVGHFFDKGTIEPLIEHWDGTRWEIVVGPGSIHSFSLCGGPLYGITALSAQDIWSVGTCLFHWNGTIWQLHAGPQLQSKLSRGIWYAVAGASTDSLWIVGQSVQLKQAVIGHWNGKIWKIASNGFSRGRVGVSTLFGLAMPSVEDAWAVGETSSASKTLLLHWKGESWQLISSPNPGSPQRVPVIHY